MSQALLNHAFTSALEAPMSNHARVRILQMALLWQGASVIAVLQLAVPSNLHLLLRRRTGGS